MDWEKIMDDLKAKKKRQEELLHTTLEHIKAIEKLMMGGEQQELKPPQKK